MVKAFDVANGAEIISRDPDFIKHDWCNQNLPKEIKELKFSGEVEIAYAKTENKKLIFKDCIFDIISIKNEPAENLSEIRFINCQINAVRIFRSETVIRFEASAVQSLVLDNCDISRIKIENSEVKNISFESKSMIEELLITNHSNVEIIDDKDAQIKRIALHSSQVESIHINNSIDSLDIKEGAVLNRFSIDSKEELKRFFKTLKHKIKTVRGGTVSQRAVELRHQQQIILAAYDQYVDENKFQEMDICLVRLRKINCILSRFKTNNPLRKFGYIIEDMVLGKMFGWGVQIINSLMTSAVVILAFAVLYFEKLIASMGDVWQCIHVSLIASVNRFFNVNEVDPISILGHFDTAEQIIGVIILTIFTGVIARKIIR